MKRGLLIAVLIVAFAASASLAVFFRHRSDAYRQQYSAAEAEAQRLQVLARAAPARSPQIVTVVVDKVVSSDVSDPSEALKEQIRQLELSLQAKDGQINMLRRDATNRTPDQARPWRDPSAWLDQIKTNDPERYKEIVTRREQARQKVQSSFAQKADHFLKRDTSDLSDDEQVQYQQMMQLLDQTWKLSDQLRTDLPRDQRWEIVGQMRDNMQTLEPLLTDERNRELYEIGRKVGYSENDATQFVAYINQLIDVTSLQNISRNMRGGGGGGGFGPGGPRGGDQPGGTGGGAGGTRSGGSGRTTP